MNDDIEARIERIELAVAQLAGYLFDTTVELAGGHMCWGKPCGEGGDDHQQKGYSPEILPTRYDDEEKAKTAYRAYTDSGGDLSRKGWDQSGQPDPWPAYEPPAKPAKKAKRKKDVQVVPYYD